MTQTQLYAVRVASICSFINGDAAFGKTVVAPVGFDHGCSGCVLEIMSNWHLNLPRERSFHENAQPTNDYPLVCIGDRRRCGSFVNTRPGV